VLVDYLLYSFSDWLESGLVLGLLLRGSPQAVRILCRMGSTLVMVADMVLMTHDRHALLFATQVYRCLPPIALSLKFGHALMNNCGTLVSSHCGSSQRDYFK